jgi:ubiquitin-conjugating enzyme E2 R
MSGELASERWSPAQRVESVLISILSLLDDPEVSSPANVDAGVAYRTARADYEAQVKKDLEASKQDIPEGFVMPTHETAFKKDKVDDKEFEMGWSDSDADMDFGGSDSDEDELEFGDEDDMQTDDAGDNDSDAD